MSLACLKAIQLAGLTYDRHRHLKPLKTRARVRATKIAASVGFPKAWDGPAQSASGDEFLAAAQLAGLTCTYGKGGGPRPMSAHGRRQPRDGAGFVVGPDVLETAT